MDVNYKRLFSVLLKFLPIIIIAVVLYYIGLPLVKMLLPFIIAALIAVFIEPIVEFFEKKLRIRRSIAALLTIIIVLIIVVALVSLLMSKIVIELTNLSNALPSYLKSIDLNNEVKYWTNTSKLFYLSVPPEVASVIQERVNESFKTLSTFATTMVSTILTGVLNTVKYFPELLVFILITIISTYFISADREKIRSFILRQFPESWSSKLTSLKNDLLVAFIGFIKVQLILIAISIIIASIGLSAVGVKYAFLMAVIIGVSELIPVVGTGSIFVPWILFMVIEGDFRTAVGLFIVFIIGVIVRQTLEPKILGDQIGIYPLVALISIYVGLQLFGVFGMILGPIIVILLKNLNHTGIIKLWND